MTVEELLAKTSSEEITYWKAFFVLENEDIETNRIKAEQLRKVKGR